MLLFEWPAEVRVVIHTWLQPRWRVIVPLAVMVVISVFLLLYGC